MSFLFHTKNIIMCSWLNSVLNCVNESLSTLAPWDCVFRFHTTFTLSFFVVQNISSHNYWEELVMNTEHKIMRITKSSGMRVTDCSWIDCSLSNCMSKRVFNGVIDASVIVTHGDHVRPLTPSLLPSAPPHSQPLWSESALLSEGATMAERAPLSVSPLHPCPTP